MRSLLVWVLALPFLGAEADPAPAAASAEVTSVVFAQAGPAVFGIPAREPAAGCGFALRGAEGLRPLQWTALTEPVAGRRWYLFRAEGRAGPCVLRQSAGPPRAASPRTLEPEEVLDLGPFPQPESLGFVRIRGELEEDGAVARVARAFYRRGALRWSVRVTRFRGGDAEITFALGALEGGAQEALSLDLSGTGPVLLEQDERGQQLALAAGRLLWVQARQRGQRGFRGEGELFSADLLAAGERLAAGEMLRFDFQFASGPAAPPLDRSGHVSFPPGFWRAAGLLPRSTSSGEGAGAAVRRLLVEAAERVLGSREEGRDFGNFRRRAKVWTNLEYDTAYALLRLEMAGGPRWLLRGAFDSAVLWSGNLLAAPGETGAGVTPGLPFVHGKRSRSGVGEVGHAWTQGALLVGLRTGDPMLLDAARAAGAALARRVLEPAGIEDLARNLGWPLLELESMVAQDPREVLVRAADALGERLLARFDRRLLVFRFAEGEKAPPGDYVERVWITGGILIPALRRHSARRDRKETRTTLGLAEVAHAARSITPDGRVRSHLWMDDATGVPKGPGAGCEHARALFVLEGWPAGGAGTAGQHALLRRSLGDPIDQDSSDLATEFSMAARLDLVMR